MGSKRNIDLFVCIATANANALTRSLYALFSQAKNPENIAVSVAWTSYSPYSIPTEIEIYANQIVVRTIAAQPFSNMLYEAMAAWSQQPKIIAIRAGVELVKDWDALVFDALVAMPELAVLTQIAPQKSSESIVKPSLAGRIVALPTILEDTAMITVGATDIAAKQKAADYRELELTPLVSFDFIAASASIWFEILPDPYLERALEDIVYSARLCTHGVSAYQLNQPLIEQSLKPSDATNGDAISKQAAIRAKHMLGISYSDENVALFELDKYGHGEVAGVEQFWAAVGVDIAASRMHPLARLGEWTALVQRPANQKIKEMQTFAMGADITDISTLPSVSQNEARIFVQIPCYRDTECQYTIKDMFEKATYPDRVFAGICWQTIPEEDEACFRIVTRPDQVRSVHHNASASKGANWARVQAGTLRRDEEYVLLIDAHTRFVEGWDKLLIKLLGMCPTPKAIISTYPTSYTLKGEVEDKHIIRMCYKEFQPTANVDAPLLKYTASRINKKDWPDAPFLASTLSSNFIFASKTLFDEVPLDPHIYFFGDDLSLMARVWTHGWEVFSPHKPVLFHLWDRKMRPQHWEDSKDYQKLAANTDKRVAHLTGMTILESDDSSLEELDQYSLGSVRSLKEFEVFIGVNFEQKKVETKAKKGIPVTADGYGNNIRNNIATPTKKITTTSTVSTVNNMMHTMQQPNVGLAIQAASANVTPFINPALPIVGGAGSKLIAPDGQHLSNHTPIKTFESEDVVVYDNFLPENVFENLYDFTIDADYRHINTTGNVNRVWAIDNGFPLRSSWNHYYEAMNQKKHPEDSTYPLNKPTDRFIEHVNKLAPEAQHIIGAAGVNWAHYSVTSWLYPPNTGLSLHNDGSQYTGAYVYFMNKEWRIHWGGLLMVLDRVANDTIESHKKANNAYKFHREKWLHESEHNEYAMEVGFARTIFPKRNRMVFIAPDAYHIVSKVLPTAGDNVRMTLAGFFNRGILAEQSQAT